MLQLLEMKNVPFVCYMKQLVLCSCLFGGAERAKAESVARRLQDYWDAERKLVDLLTYIFLFPPLYYGFVDLRAQETMNSVVVL